jgi:hypothetical protein
MFKKFVFIVMCFFSVAGYAKEYAHSFTFGIIHTTTIQSSWCGNLAVSTKVGKLSDSGECTYLKETQAQAFDTCDPLQLNGGLLEQNIGLGFNCAATHAHSNVTGHDGLDKYTLILDSNGHYTNTTPNQGNINLG